MATSTQIVSTVTKGLALRGIDVKEIMDAVAREEYPDCKLSFKNVANCTAAESAQLQKRAYYSNSPWSDTGAKDNFKYANTNIRHFRTYMQDRTRVSPYSEGGHCMSCHDDYTHHGMGIPLSITRTTDIQHLDVFDKTAHYYEVPMIDEVCCFQCARYHHDVLIHQPAYRELLHESLNCLETLFAMQNPDKVLSAAKDPRLHRRLGGGMDDAEYFEAGQNRFIPVPTLLTYPAVNMFISDTYDNSNSNNQ